MLPHLFKEEEWVELMALVSEEKGKLQSHCLVLQHREDGDYICSVMDGVAVGPPIAPSSPTATLAHWGTSSAEAAKATKSANGKLGGNTASLLLLLRHKTGG